LLQWKAMSITYCKCVFVDLGIQQSMRMRYILIFGLPVSTIFYFHIIPKKSTIFEKKKIFEHKFRDMILSQSFLTLKELSELFQKCVLVFM
jgi:hypothetical protein